MNSILTFILTVYYQPMVGQPTTNQPWFVNQPSLSGPISPGALVRWDGPRIYVVKSIEACAMAMAERRQHGC